MRKTSTWTPLSSEQIKVHKSNENNERLGESHLFLLSFSQTITRSPCKEPVHHGTLSCECVCSDELPLKPADFDSTIGHCPVSDENSACWVPVRHSTLSDGDVKVCLSYDSALRWIWALGEISDETEMFLPPCHCFLCSCVLFKRLFVAWTHRASCQEFAHCFALLS